MTISPWAKYQLFRNPFGELTRSERSELAVVDLSDYLAWLARPKAALQFTGPCGHGKTTHLLALQRALALNAQAAADPTTNGCDLTHGDCVPGYVYFPEDGSQPPLPSQRPLLVDEAQRMSWRRRRQLWQGAGPLVIGTHVDLRPGLQRSGFEVWSIDLDAPLSTARLQQILNRRILASRLKIVGHESLPSREHHPLCLSTDQVVALQDRFGSNIRSIEHFLFDALQRFVQKGDPWLPVS